MNVPSGEMSKVDAAARALESIQEQVQEAQASSDNTESTTKEDRETDASDDDVGSGEERTALDAAAEALKRIRQKAKIVEATQSTESDSEEPCTKNKDDETAFQILPKLSSDHETELAHCFEEWSYTAPTNCDICTGLLVGLWSQGFHCRMCGLNVHRGGGKGDHDDCRAEALLTACPGEKQEKPQQRASQATTGDAMAIIRELAADSPSFLAEISEQLDKDIMAHASKLVVNTVVEDERKKKFRRLRESLVPFVQRIDWIQSWGELVVFGVLLLFQAILTAIVAAIAAMSFLVALWPGRGFDTDTAREVALVHTSTVVITFHVTVFLLSLVFCYGSRVLTRKMVIIDRFLREFFGIEAKEDFGISVEAAVLRFRFWSGRITISFALTTFSAFFFWRRIAVVSSELEVSLESAAAVGEACKVEN